MTSWEETQNETQICPTGAVPVLVWGTGNDFSGPEWWRESSTELCPDCQWNQSSRAAMQHYQHRPEGGRRECWWGCLRSDGGGQQRFHRHRGGLSQRLRDNCVIAYFIWTMHKCGCRIFSCLFSRQHLKPSYKYSIFCQFIKRCCQTRGLRCSQCFFTRDKWMLSTFQTELDSLVDLWIREGFFKSKKSENGGGESTQKERAGLKMSSSQDTLIICFFLNNYWRHEWTVTKTILLFQHFKKQFVEILKAVTKIHFKKQCKTLCKWGSGFKLKFHLKNWLLICFLIIWFSFAGLRDI